jgi:isoleucyl-tRNA synthetase
LTAALEGYDTAAATQLLQSFVADLAGVYIPLSRQRFAEKAAAEERQAACSTLHQTLVSLSKMLAPFIPFLADEFHHKLVRSFDFSSSISVHLTDWPAADEAAIDLELDRRMVLLQRIASLGRSARTDAGIALYQPLSGAVVMLNNQDEIGALQPFSDLLADVLHVRQVSSEIDGTLMAPDEIRIILDPHLTVELAQEGLVDEFIRRVQDFCQKAGIAQEASIRLFVNATPRLAQAISTLQARILEEAHCLEIKLVSQPASQQPHVELGVEQGRISRRLYTMAEFDGERVTFGIEKVSDH